MPAPWPVNAPRVTVLNPELTMSSPSRTIRSRVVSVTAIAALTFTAACSGDSVSQPDFAARQGKSGLTADAFNALISVTALTRDEAVPEGVVDTFTVTEKGGTLEIKETGLKIDVPEGAIPGRTLTIIVTALPGKAVAYDFQPHGTKFLKPLAFRQDLKNTSWDKLGFKGTIQGGYFKDVSQIDLRTGIAILDELFPVKFTDKNISFDINHFSGYMVSSGRKGVMSEESAF